MFDRSDIRFYDGTNTNIVVEPHARFYDPYKHGITQGVLATWLTCPEKARLSLIEGVSAQGSKYALDFGNIFHENLDRTYTDFANSIATYDDILVTSMNHLRQQEVQLVESMLASMDGSQRIGEIEHAFALVRTVLWHYFKQWGSDFRDREWLALEEEFYVPYLDTYSGRAITLRGKIDGVYKAKDGTLWIMDHKTKSVIDDDAMVGRLSFDLQMGFYMYAVRQMYGDVSGFMYNLVRRPALRQGKSETQSQFMDRIHSDIDLRTGTYFSRHQVQFMESDNVVFERELRQIIHAFLTWYEGVGPHYRNSTACLQRGYTCEMLDYCSGSDSPLYQRKTRVFPELSGDSTPENNLGLKEELLGRD